MMNINDIEVESARSLSTIENMASDSSLAAAQFEAIIRAWKGEVVGLEGDVPLSPVGEADLDGSLSLGELETDEIHMYIPVSLGSFCCTPACTYTCWGCTYTYVDPCQES